MRRETGRWEAGGEGGREEGHPRPWRYPWKTVGSVGGRPFPRGRLYQWLEPVDVKRRHLSIRPTHCGVDPHHRLTLDSGASAERRRPVHLSARTCVALSTVVLFMKMSVISAITDEYDRIWELRGETFSLAVGVLGCVWLRYSSRGRLGKTPLSRVGTGVQSQARPVFPLIMMVSPCLTHAVFFAGSLSFAPVWTWETDTVLYKSTNIESHFCSGNNIQTFTCVLWNFPFPHKELEFLIIRCWL